MGYLKIINPHYLDSVPPNTHRITERVINALDFNKLSNQDLNKTPVFTQVDINKGVLQSGSQCPIFDCNGKDFILDEVNIRFNINNRTLPPRSTIKLSSIDGSLYQNNFQRTNFYGSTFNKSISEVDFQQATLSNTTFNEAVSNCNFINAQLQQAHFTKKITGFTCFSGANLDNAVFDTPCENTVVFIGSNLSTQLKKPQGGIQTVSDLETALKNNQFNPDQILELQQIISFAHTQVAQSLITFAHVPYHLNENHLDHLKRAEHTLNTHLLLSKHSNESPSI